MPYEELQTHPYQITSYPFLPLVFGCITSYFTKWFSIWLNELVNLRMINVKVCVWSTIGGLARLGIYKVQHPKLGNPYRSLARQSRVDAWVTRQQHVWIRGILATVCYFMCFVCLFAIIKTLGDLDNVASTISPFLMMTNQIQKQIKLTNVAKTSAPLV